ncbi:receptor-type tyrosine-protein phosphatase mu isoform X1, partial [Lates japonicus]
AVDMDKVINCLFAAITLLLSARGEVFKGDCNFEKPLAACGYSQGRDDDLDWEQANTREKPSSDPWMPSGSAFMMVNTSGRFAGQKALLLTPQLKENDTHCVIFHYYIGGRDNSHPGHLNVYIKENNSPMGMPVWNVSGPATRSWAQVELAISTYWPNFYQIVFEAVTSGQRGLLAIKDVVVQGHQCMNTPHFLTIKGVEVNAGQTASFHCTVNGRKRDNFRLWLQGIGGREAPMKATKPWNNRRFIGTFDVENTTKGDSGRYRCIVHSDKGVGVSNYGELTIKRTTNHWLGFFCGLILAVQTEAGRCCGRGGASCRWAACPSGQHHDNSVTLTPAHGCHCPRRLTPQCRACPRLPGPRAVARP